MDERDFIVDDDPLVGFGAFQRQLDGDVAAPQTAGERRARGGFQMVETRRQAEAELEAAPIDTFQLPNPARRA